MKLIATYLVFLITATLLLAQHEADTWYFGKNAGLKFTSSGTTVLTDGAMNAMEGCATISHPNTGGLLFYTDGEKVWNRNHTLMPNGTGLKGYRSSAQSAVIVPHSCDTNLYYIFTTDGSTFDPSTFRDNFPNDSVFAYSIVDMRLNGGLGDITAKNVYLFSPVNETVAAVKHKNGVDTWVVAHEYLSTRFFSYLITSTGVEGPIISDGEGVRQSSGRSSYLKFSPTGQRIAFGQFAMEVFDFDNETGVVSKDPINLGIGSGAYGFSFSPNGEVLYVADNRYNSIVQYDLSFGPSQDVISNQTTVQAGYEGNTLQCGPDGKIYVQSEYPDLEFLSVIDQPNVTGVGCGFRRNAVMLGGRKGDLGLPNFVESYFDPNYNSLKTQPLQADFSNSNTICLGDSISFFNTAKGVFLYSHWDFGDSKTSEAHNGSHLYSQPGVYEVELAVGNCRAWDTLRKTVMVKSCDSLNLKMPNVFTPNLDGSNDVFMPISADGIASAYISIYNRWGRKVFESSNLQQGWDGKANGEDCSPGVYFWIVAFADQNNRQQSLTGNLTLLR